MKEKSSDSSTKKNCPKFFGIVLIIIGLSALLFKMPDNKTGLIIYKVSILICLLLVLVGTVILIAESYFNERTKFNSDTTKLFSLYGVIELLLFLFSVVFADNYKKFCGHAYVIPALFLMSGVFFWCIYYARCSKTIKELKKEKYILIVNSVKSVLGATLVWWASTKIIGSFEVGTDYHYYFFNILVNLSYPLLVMYVYVRN